LKFKKKMNIAASSIIKQSNVKLITFNSNKISTLGKSTIKCFYKQKYYFIEFFIVDFSCNTKLRLETCNNLNLISRINVINNDKEISILDEIEDDIMLHVKNLIQNKAISKNKLDLIKKRNTK